MKRILALLLICIYLLPALGIWGNLHYCGKKICRVDLLTEAKDGKCCGGKPMKRDCCKDKKFSVKKSGQEVNSKIIGRSFSQILPLTAVTVVRIQDCIYHTRINISLADYQPPPPDAKHPTYLSNRCFRL